MDIGKILKKARLDAGVAMQTVEEATGVLFSMQSKIERGETLSPAFFPIAKLAKYYNLDLNGVFEATQTTQDNLTIAAKATSCKHVPIITWNQAAQWSASPPDEWEHRTIPSPFDCSDKSFALKVRGDSMASMPGTQYNFPDGSIIIIDPTIEAKHKSFVIARVKGTEEITFKRLSIDGKKYLQPLNPQYPVITADENITICGVIIGSVQEIT